MARGRGRGAARSRRSTGSGSAGGPRRGRRGSQPASQQPRVVEQALGAWLLRERREAVVAMLLAADPEVPYAVAVDFPRLAAAHPRVAERTLARGTEGLRVLRRALQAAQVTLMRTHDRKEEMVYKELASVRLERVKEHCEAQGPGPAALHCPALRCVRSHHSEKLVHVAGTVTRNGTVRLLEWQKLFECAECGHTFRVELEPESGAPDMPARCPGPEGGKCKGRAFLPSEEEFFHKDYQEIRLQESMQTVSFGTAPSTIVVVLEDELVDACRPGDDVEVVGAVVNRFKVLKPEARCHAELVVRANNVFVRGDKRAGHGAYTERDAAQFAQFWGFHQDRPLVGRNKILTGICPQLYGLFLPKLATALTLMGGMARQEGSTRIRGDCHCLIVGDPGTGKSQLMKCAAKISPRAVMTTGKGSSGVGLTAAAVKEGHDWVLEAGALVLGDGGLCCIDEFDGIRRADQATIHEAMEQQTISVAKAGLVSTLNTRTAVFAITNPKGAYDAKENVSVNTSLSAPLLSRFDILLVLKDTKNKELDRQISGHILGLDEDAGGAAAAQTPWTLEILRKYFAYCKDTFQPALTEEAESVLTGYYQMQRGYVDRSLSRTTIRMLESLVRLAEAHARLMCRHDVLVQDAVVAIVIAEASAALSPILGPMDSLATEFAEDPDEEFERIQRKVLVAVRGATDALLLQCGGPSQLQRAQEHGGHPAAAAPEGGNKVQRMVDHWKNHPAKRRRHIPPQPQPRLEAPAPASLPAPARPAGQPVQDLLLLTTDMAEPGDAAGPGAAGAPGPGLTQHLLAEEARTRTARPRSSDGGAAASGFDSWLAAQGEPAAPPARAAFRVAAVSTQPAGGGSPDAPDKENRCEAAPAKPAAAPTPSAGGGFPDEDDVDDLEI